MILEPRWRKGTRAKVKARVAAEELERLSKEREGPLRPQDIVDESRPVDAVLHPQFTWEDGMAAEKWRCQEARITVNHLVYVEVDAGEDEPVEHGPVFVSVEVDNEERGYIPTKVAMQSADLRSQAIHEAVVALRGWRKRHANLKELGNLFSAIDRELSRVSDEAA